MPYKNPEKKREYRRRWYANHKSSEISYVRRRKKRIKDWFNSYKESLKCSECKENHPAILDFHHTSSKKEFGISKMVGEGYSIDRIKKELEKCDVLCANCHRKVHFKNNKL